MSNENPTAFQPPLMVMVTRHHSRNQCRITLLFDYRWIEREGLWPSKQRGGVVWISRRAHNPEIDGSNPSLATTHEY